MNRLAISLNLINAALASGLLATALAADMTLRSILLHFSH
jgi:hypothetical protein